MNIPSYYVQSRIARVESISSAVSGGNVVYTFRSHPYFTQPYNGLVIVRLGALPSGATGTEPVVFTSADNGNVSLTEAGGSAVTAASLLGEGIYLVYYDSTTNKLQLL